MYKFRKVSSIVKPDVIDLTSSKYGIYYRKNIEQIERETSDGAPVVEYQYDEIYLPNNFRFAIKDTEIYISKIEEILQKLNAEFEEKRAAKHLENNTKAEVARYNQNFTITIQGKDCTFDTSRGTQSDLLTAFAVCSTGATYDGWITNNGVELNLTLEDVALIANTFKELSNVYPKWNEFNIMIDNAATIEELEAIIIDYYKS